MSPSPLSLRSYNFPKNKKKSAEHFIYLRQYYYPRNRIRSKGLFELHVFTKFVFEILFFCFVLFWVLCVCLRHTIVVSSVLLKLAVNSFLFFDVFAHSRFDSNIIRFFKELFLLRRGNW
jgi:hypothetical protein